MKINANQRAADRTCFDKVKHVRTFFDRPENYLPKRRLDIRLRAETVRDLALSRDFRDILDIGCGDGSISVPLLTARRRLTLLDISPNMLSIANSRIAPELASNVTLINQDFLTAEFEPRSFDLVICLGVLAHISSPSDAIARTAAVLRPGGTLILEWTDSSHFVGRITVFYNIAVALINRPTYCMNLLSSDDVISTAERHGFESITEYRYALPLPKTTWMFTSSGLYGATRAVFGDVKRNRNAWLGNQHIHCFTRGRA